MNEKKNDFIWINYKSNAEFFCVYLFIVLKKLINKRVSKNIDNDNIALHTKRSYSYIRTQYYYIVGMVNKYVTAVKLKCTRTYSIITNRTVPSSHVVETLITAVLHRHRRTPPCLMYEQLLTSR